MAVIEEKFAQSKQGKEGRRHKVMANLAKI